MLRPAGGSVVDGNKIVSHRPCAESGKEGVIEKRAEKSE